MSPCYFVKFSHLSTGQEAVAVGIEHAITKDDNVFIWWKAGVMSRSLLRTDVTDSHI